MAVVYDIPSGNTVDKDQAIGVTVDYTPGLVVGAGPRESNRPLEFVYAPPPGSSPGAEGVFLYPYLGSEKVGSHLVLRRTGGMPEGWRYRVFEAPPPPPIPENAQPWRALYEVDFTTLDPQTFTTPGAKVIDGLTWWLKGAFSGHEFGQINVAGLDARGLYIGGTGMQLPDGAVDLNFLHWFLPLANIPNANPDAPLIVRAHLTSDTQIDRYPMIGVADSTSDAVGFRAAQRAREIFCGPASTSPSSSIRNKRGIGPAGEGPSITGAPSAAFGNLVCGVIQMLPEVAIEGSHRWDGAMAAYTTLRTPISVGPFVHAVRSNPGIAMVGALNGGGVLTVHMKRLSVHQPRVAA